MSIPIEVTISITNNLFFNLKNSNLKNHTTLMSLRYNNQNCVHVFYLSSYALYLNDLYKVDKITNE